MRLATKRLLVVLASEVEDMLTDSRGRMREPGHEIKALRQTVEDEIRAEEGAQQENKS